MFYASSTPGSVGPQMPILHFDKLAHFLFFLGGGFVLTSWWISRKNGEVAWKKIVPLFIAILAVIGWLDEWHQTFTPYRSGNDIFDWMADVLGGAAGVMIRKIIHQRRSSLS